MSVEQRVLKLCQEFIEALPEEVSFVVTEDSEELTKTIGREYLLTLIGAARDER